MYDWMKKEKNIFLALGLAAGIVIPKILTAQKTRDFAVLSLAKGMMLKDSVMEEVANIREEADDICEEARFLAQVGCDCMDSEDSDDEE